MTTVDDLSKEFRQQIGYRLCTDDFMEIIHELIGDEECHGPTLMKVFERMNEQFEIRKLDDFKVSEDFANIIKSVD